MSTKPAGEEVNKDKKPEIRTGDPEETVENLYGERILHIYIEESFGIWNGKEGTTIDAVMEVKAYGEKKYTRVQKEISQSSQSYWGQHLFFENEFKDKYELETAQIEVKVYDHYTVGANSLIGSFSISQEMIYASENHCMLHSYFPLLNVEKDPKLIYGFVKASVHVARPGDVRVKLDDESKLDKIDSQGKGMNKIMLPPQVKVKKLQIEIRVVAAERVVKMDYELIGTGTADPYLELSYGGMKLKSRTCKDTLTPVWNQKVMIPSVAPAINDRMTLVLYDEDVTGDEVIGSISLDYKEIEKGTVV